IHHGASRPSRAAETCSGPVGSARLTVFRRFATNRSEELNNYSGWITRLFRGFWMPEPVQLKRCVRFLYRDGIALWLRADDGARHRRKRQRHDREQFDTLVPSCITTPTRSVCRASRRDISRTIRVPTSPEETCAQLCN